MPKKELTLEDKLRLVEDRLVVQTRMNFGKLKSDVNSATYDVLERICDRVLEVWGEINPNIFQKFADYILKYTSPKQRTENPETTAEAYERIERAIEPYREQRKTFRATDLINPTGMRVKQISYYLTNYDLGIRAKKGARGNVYYYTLKKRR